jgi:uncharacterized protein (DUF849 family)
MQKAIISCAITGAIHTPSMSPHLPITPRQIVDESIAAAKAGAAILHLHARDPETGQPTADPDIFMQFLPEIHERTNAVVNITTGGGLGMTIAERLAAATVARPELASLNMGSLNFGIFRAAENIPTFRHDWERPYLEMTRDFVLSNTFAQIEQIVKTLTDFGTRFEFEIYDIGQLYNLAWCIDAGLVKPPFFIQGVFGILGGIGPDLPNLVYMKEVADRLFGKDYVFSALGAGRHQMRVVTQSALLGGSVRVGLEDSLHLRKGLPAQSNAEQVHLIRDILNALSIEIATPDEAREMLALKGPHGLGF